MERCMVRSGNRVLSFLNESGVNMDSDVR
jgi:hypothetical protein